MRPCGLTSATAHRERHLPVVPAGSGWRPGPFRAPPPGANHALAAGSAARSQLHRPHQSRHGCRALHSFVKDVFDAFLECGTLTHGFLRLRCGECGLDRLLAFSFERRGIRSSCGARRMSQTAAHLVDHVMPHVPLPQRVRSLPIPLRSLLKRLRRAGPAHRQTKGSRAAVNGLRSGQNGSAPALALAR